jgi:hypothetical protein
MNEGIIRKNVRSLAMDGSLGGCPMQVKSLVVLAGLVATATVGSASHHSFDAEFDRDQPLEVSGRVVRVEWTNPHARIYVEAADPENEDGPNLVWDFELGPPNGLMRRGWNRNSLQPGTPVTVNGFRSRTEPLVANARTVSLADGRQVFVGSSFDTSPVQ